jgi:hypothetical protein
VIGGILDKVTGFLDQRLIQTSLLPSLAFWSAVAVLTGGEIGWGRARTWWVHLGTGTSVLLVVVAVAVLVLFALVLSAQEGALLRLYEGYWGRSDLAVRLARRAAKRHADRVEGLNKDIGKLTDDITKLHDADPEKQAKTRQVAVRFEYQYRNYPRDAVEAMPTRLGNILKSAELYPAYEGRYRMDAVFFWPRLIAVVPDAARADLSDARASLTLLLNVCTLALLLSAGAFVTLAAAMVHPAVAFWAAAGGGLLVALLAHRSALSPAKVYAELVRATFDLYRGDLLGQMKFALPDTLADERALWATLGQQMYRGATSTNTEEVLNAARAAAVSPAPPAPTSGTSGTSGTAAAAPRTSEFGGPPAG